jgi:hypothetical protein
MQELTRLALWGLAGTGAITLAAFAIASETGRDRLRQAVAQVEPASKTMEPARSRAFDEQEGRQLADAVRSLKAEREAMLTRIASLEQSIVNVADSVTRMVAIARPAQPSQDLASIWPVPSQPAPATTHSAASTQTTTTPAAAPPPTPVSGTTSPSVTPLPTARLAANQSTATSNSLPSSTSPSAITVQPKTAPLAHAIPPLPKDRPSTLTAPGDDVTSSTSAMATLARRAPDDSEGQATDTIAGVKTEYGLDLGTAPTVEGVRALWLATQRRHALQLEGLYPILRMRERPRPGGVELRLVAGPLTSATAAARICIAMSAAGVMCQPTLFDGQRLALR